MKRTTRSINLTGAWMLCMIAASPALAASAATTPAQPASVDIRSFAFTPKALTIHTGTRVVWTNRDEEPHVVVSAGKQFAASRALDTSDSYAVTFDHPGTYTYYCAIHPMMVGTIIVQ